jgi:hypothetical protein
MCGGRGGGCQDRMDLRNFLLPELNLRILMSQCQLVICVSSFFTQEKIQHFTNCCCIYVDIYIYRHVRLHSSESVVLNLF